MCKIGFTNDGKVFMIIMSTIEGKPVETLLQWEPSQAKAISMEIDKAVTEAQSRKVIQ